MNNKTKQILLVFAFGASFPLYAGRHKGGVHKVKHVDNLAKKKNSSVGHLVKNQNPVEEFEGLVSLSHFKHMSAPLQYRQKIAYMAQINHSWDPELRLLCLQGDRYKNERNALCVQIIRKKCSCQFSDGFNRSHEIQRNSEDVSSQEEIMSILTPPEAWKCTVD